MLRLRSCGFLAASLSIAGCSIHPLPDDVTRDTTLEIINKIRCEARDTLVERIIDVLVEEESPTNMKLLDKLNQPWGTSAENMCNLSPYEFDSRARDRLEKFRTAAATYSFEFTISENKVKSGGATFKMPFTQGTFTLGLSAGSDKTRKNLREITFGDTFSSLLFGRYVSGRPTGLDCDLVHKPRKHWIYPITGNIGLDEVITTFISLAKITEEVSTFSDTLTFTTDLNVGAKPSVELTRLVPRKLNLTAANIDYTAKRSDAHQVKIVLKIPEPEAPKKKTTTSFYELYNSETTSGLPKGSKFGFAMKTPADPPSAKIPSKYTKCPILQPIPVLVTRVRRDGTPVQVMMKNPFAITESEEKMSLRQGLEESRRLESVDRERTLDIIRGR